MHAYINSINTIHGIQIQVSFGEQDNVLYPTVYTCMYPVNFVRYSLSDYLFRVAENRLDPESQQHVQAQQRIDMSAVLTEINRIKGKKLEGTTKAQSLDNRKELCLDTNLKGDVLEVEKHTKVAAHGYKAKLSDTELAAHPKHCQQQLDMKTISNDADDSKVQKLAIVNEDRSGSEAKVNKNPSGQKHLTVKFSDSEIVKNDESGTRQHGSQTKASEHPSGQKHLTVTVKLSDSEIMKMDKSETRQHEVDKAETLTAKAQTEQKDVQISLATSNVAHKTSVSCDTLASQRSSPSPSVSLKYKTAVLHRSSEDVRTSIHMYEPVLLDIQSKQVAPVFHKSSGDVRPSSGAHTYEIIPDIQSKQATLKHASYKSKVRSHKFPSLNKPKCLSREELRINYKHRPPPSLPPNLISQNSRENPCSVVQHDGYSSTSKPDKLSKEYKHGALSPKVSQHPSIDDSGVNQRTTCPSKGQCHSSPSEHKWEETNPDRGKQTSVNKVTVSKGQLCKEYRHRPPPPKPSQHIKDLYQPLLSESHTNVYECLQTTSSSNSNSASDETDLFAWRMETDKQIPPTPDQTSVKSHHGSQLHYQPLQNEEKRSLRSLEKRSKEPRSCTDDSTPDENLGSDCKFVDNDFDEKGQPKGTHHSYPSIASGSDHLSDTEGNYMPLIPKRKKNIVISEYVSLHN